MSKRVNRTLSAAIVAVLYAGTGYAQQPPAEEKSATELETVVVTGSLIRGTPVDAALPVEVFTAEDLKQQGDPSPLEFVKSLSISGPTTGEAYYFSGSQLTNNVQFNLRGIGADKTLTLFNSRRAFQNVSVYPSIALERTEVLKDGAAVTYGADATGGVVNLITKRDFDGFEVGSSYKHYKGTDEGEWKLGAMAGFTTDYANVLFAVEWDHRSELDTLERDFSSPNYAANPTPSSQLTNLAGWVPRGALPAATPQPPLPTPGVAPFPATANGEWGAPRGLLHDFTQASCEAVGGIFVLSTTASPFNKCAYNYISYYNLVEENDVYRVFAQVTAKITDSTDFHLTALWARNYSPHQYGSPSQPVIRGPARATGATHQLYIPATNPHALAFAQRTGWATNPLFAGTAGYTPITYRAFAHGGNDTFAFGDNHSTPNENETKYWHVTGGFNGDLGEAFGFDVAATFNQSVANNTAPDIIGFRLQEALNGFGGPNCNAQDLDPYRYGTQNASAAGQGNCMWYNPFSTNFARQPTLGLTNPNYSATAENPRELIEWLFNERRTEATSWNFTFDAVFSGVTPLSLWSSDNIAWGVGGQWRTEKNRESVPDPLYNGMTPCDWPNQDPRSTLDPLFDGCTLDRAGPFLFFGANPPDATEQKRQSYFVQVDLPVYDADMPFLNNLSMIAAGRYEEFAPIGLDATVYKVSAKWQLLDYNAARVGLRGSYGTNYQAPGAGVIPGDINNGVASYTRASGAWLGATTVTLSDIEPETAKVWNVGLIGQFEVGSTDLQIILDYFNIKTEDELGLLASVNDIADAIFDPTTRLANCSHPLIARVTFNSGSCVPGTSTALSGVNGFSTIRTDFGNGPGQHTTGFDLQLVYGFDVGPGRTQLSATVTKVEKLESEATVIDGVTIKPVDDRLGFLNFATIANAAPEWRGNFSVNYSIGEHNIRAVLNYVSGVKDERFIRADGTADLTLLRPEGYQPGTTTPFAPSLYGVIGDKWLSGDLHYLWRAGWATVGLSVLNVTDEDPPESRQEFGFDPRIGNALGRQFELSLRKEF